MLLEQEQVLGPEQVLELWLTQWYRAGSPGSSAGFALFPALNV